MLRFYLELQLSDSAAVRSEGFDGLIQRDQAGHLFVRARIADGQRLVYITGRLYSPATAEALTDWARAFDSREPGNWARGCDGDFTVVVHEPERSMAWVIADRNGQQRAYAAVEKGVLRVSNSLVHLARNLESPQLSQDGVFHLLALRYAVDPTTVIENVLATAPGSIFRTDGGSFDIKRYHTVVEHDGPYFTTMKECVDGLDSACRTVFAKRLDTTRRPVLLLSGGIDSVTMLRYATEVAGRRVEAFTFGVQGDEDNEEITSARMAARHFGVSHDVVFIDPGSVALRFAAAFREADGPHYGVALWLALHELVASGDGDADIFSGQDTRLHTPSFDLPRSLGVRFSQAPAPVKALWNATLETTRLWPWRGRRTFAYWRRVAAAHDSPRAFVARVLANIPEGGDGLRRESLDAALGAIPHKAGFQEIFKTYVEFELKTQFTDDMNTIVSSLQDERVGVHFPFYDHDLVAACNRIPYAIGARHMFTTRSWSWIPFTQKAVLRKLLQRTVPAELVYRRKSTLPTIHTAFNRGLRDLVDRIFRTWGSDLVASLDRENSARVAGTMSSFANAPAEFRFPEQHDLAWDAYSVAYLAVLQQLIRGNERCLDEVDSFANEAVLSARGVARKGFR